MKKHIIANWKSFEGLATLKRFELFKTQNNSNYEVTLCPEAPLLSLINTEEMGVSLGAQDCSPHEKGAFTGDIPAALLEELKIKYCLVGHSERRQHHHETEETLLLKLAQLIKHDITPIYCVGEKAQDREDGHTESILQQQLMILAGLKPKRLIIAYEPVWAIGGSTTPTAQEITSICELVKREVEQDIIFAYGGSVNEQNAHEILALKGVDAILVGRASTDPAKLLEMIS